MKVEILDKELARIDGDETHKTARFDQAIHKAFRKDVGFIRAAQDQRDLRNFKALRLEQLSGKRGKAGQSSMRLNDQFRLIVRFRSDEHGQTVMVVEIVDYHGIKNR